MDLSHCCGIIDISLLKTESRSISMFYFSGFLFVACDLILTVSISDLFKRNLAMIQKSNPFDHNECIKKL